MERIRNKQNNNYGQRGATTNYSNGDAGRKWYKKLKFPPYGWVRLERAFASYYSINDNVWNVIFLSYMKVIYTQITEKAKCKT